MGMTRAREERDNVSANLYFVLVDFVGNGDRRVKEMIWIIWGLVAGVILLVGGKAIG
jgi:hypothetical protein